MKSVTKLVMGAAVVAASLSSVAHAASLTTPIITPSTDNTNLLFFVSDTTAQTTYTVVLNQQVNNAGGMFTTADATGPSTAGTINTIYGKSNFSVSLSGDTALSTFLGQTTHSYTYGVVGLAYSGSTATARSIVGNVLFVGSSSNATSPLSIGEGNIVGSSTTSYSSDVRTLNSQTTYDTFNGTTNGTIGTPTSAGGTNLTSLYGTGLNTGTSAIGTSYGLYGFTSTGSQSGTATAFSLGSILFDGTTLSFTGNAAPVPLPAAAWLLGSGLLGLLGVGRRRDVSAA